MTVSGSSGLGEVVGVSATDPAALLRQAEARPASHVIVLAPWYAVSLVREQAHVLVAGQPHTRVCVLPFRHHVLTLTLLAAVAQELKGAPNGWSEPGGAVQMIKQAAALSRSLVWYPRAWGLDETEASVGQRAASLFRPRGYFTEIGAAGLVEGRAGLTRTPDETLWSLGEPPALLRTQLSSDTCSPVAVTVADGGPYAARHAVELTGLVRPTRRPVQGEPCSSCSARRSAAECLFCGVGPRTGITQPRQRESADRLDQPISVGGAAA